MLLFLWLRIFWCFAFAPSLSHPLTLKYVFPSSFPLYCTLHWFFPWLLFFYPSSSVNFSNISANDNIHTHSSRTSNLTYLSNLLICFTFQSFCLLLRSWVIRRCNTISVIKFHASSIICFPNDIRALLHKCFTTQMNFICVRY